MKCEHGDCFTCPYEDCIADAKELPKEAPSQGSEYHKTWYEAHKEHVRAYQKKYYQEHKIKCLEQRRQYREQHKEEQREYARKRYQENRDKLIEQAKARYHAKKGVKGDEMRILSSDDT